MGNTGLTVAKAATDEVMDATDAALSQWRTECVRGGRTLPCALTVPLGKLRRLLRLQARCWFNTVSN